MTEGAAVIEPGQEYVPCSPGGGPRIRVVGKPISMFGQYEYGKVEVETVLPDGRGVRRRAIDAGQLHDSATTRDGQPRRTGYALNNSKEN